MMKPSFLGAMRSFLSLRFEHWKDRDAILRLQDHRLSRIIEEARDAPYYSRALADLPSSPSACAQELGSIQITPKDEVRKDPGRFIRKGLRMDSLCEMHTSGSTGAPARLFFDKDALEHRTGIGFLLAQDFRRSPSDLFAQVTRCDFTDFPILSSLGIYRKRFISVFENEEKIFSTLCDIRPDILGWYPSMSQALAKMNDASGRPLRLKSVFCGGEVLFPQMRRDIEESFACTVYDQYASAEFSAIAWECAEEHSMHVNSSSFILEIVDDKGRPKKSGPGDIVITSLCNHAMPLIRYPIGDAGSWGKDCPCGRGTPVLASLEGRSDDSIILPSGKVRNSFAFNLLHYGRSIEGIWKYQIRQESEGLFVFCYVPFEKGLSIDDQDEIRRRILLACLNEDVRVEFEEADSIPREKSGKLLKLVSKVWKQRKI